MMYREQPPPADLADVIDRVWTLESRETPESQRIVPDGYSEILIHYGDPPAEQPTLALAGQLNEPMLFTPSALMHVIGLRLKPWGAWSITGLPQWEAAGGVIELGSVFCAQAENLMDRIRSRRRAVPKRVAAIASALQANPHLRVGDAAQQAGISARQLEREFLDKIGLTPKRFALIARLQSALRFRKTQPSWTWARIASEAGFADQAHLVKAFRSIAGVVPSDLEGEWTHAMIRL